MTLDVTRLIKEASDAASHAPKHLQEAAFNRAFEALLAAGGAGSTPKDVTPALYAGGDGGPARTPSELDRTAYPGITHDKNAHDNSLQLLLAAKNDLGIDGLSATDIAKTLTNKFRCATSRPAVSTALNGAGTYVDRHPEGRAVIFRIMAAGETYVTGLTAVPKEVSPTAPRRARRRKSTAEKIHKGEDSNESSGVPKKASGKGAASAMNELFDKGFFSEPRTIGDIRSKLKDDLGRSFKSNYLSPVLVRWLRSQKLTRETNSDGQYEYRKP